MKILLGVTGGIAAYKSLELVRLFVKNGDEVQVVMTEGAKQFIQPLSFQALSGKPVRDSLFDANQEAGMGHIELARWADIIVIAPATAESLAKLRMGRADELLSTLVVATNKPILLAPAMNHLMWSNAATQENITVLQDRGLSVMHPGSGEQACGEVGEGRMQEPPAIFNATLTLAEQEDKNHQAWSFLQDFWQGKRLLISAGPTHEAIDPVRFIGNRSSGKMGFAIAEVAAKAGAQVTLVSGSVNLPTPANVARVDVKSAEQMFAAVKDNYQNQTAFISAAAVADYRVAEVAEQKIKKTEGQDELTLSLQKNPDIVSWVAQQEDKPFVVGFAAETEKVLDYAQDKLQRKHLDMICANQVGNNQGFDSADNQLTLLTATEKKPLERSSKKQQALELLQFMTQQLTD